MPAPKDFPEMWAALKAEVKKATEGSSFSGTGVHPNGNQGLDSDNYAEDGSGNAISGFTLNGNTGVAKFKDIVLYDLPNSMLASPTSPEAIYAQTTNFGLSTTLANKLTKTLTVPAGFTKAAITVTCRIFVYNPNTTGGYDGAGGDYLYGQANVQGFNGWALPLAVSGSGGSGTNTSTFSTVLTGLTGGGSVLVQAAAQSAFASIAADPGNVAELSGMANWYR